MNVRPNILCLRVMCLTLCMCWTCDCLADEDRVLTTRIESQQVDVDLFLPKESKPVRGLLVHVANHSLKTSGRWATLCRELHFAHVVTKIDRKSNNRPTRIGKAIQAAMDEFAAQHNIPELPRLPRMGTGFSAGGMCIPALMDAPERLITNAVSCSWVSDPEKLDSTGAKIPTLYIIGAKPDAFKMLPAIDNHYAPAVKTGYPWALGLQHECKHDWANSGTLFVPWLRALAELRLPEQATPAGQTVTLSTVDTSGGWRGDRSTIYGQFATITPASEYKGKPENSVWLPNQAVASVWRAWQTKDSPIQITASSNRRRLQSFQPRKSFGVSFKTGDAIELGITGQTSKISPVTFYAGDQEIGTCKSNETLTWTPDKKRAYAVWAQYTLNEKPAVTNPALICIED